MVSEANGTRRAGLPAASASACEEGSDSDAWIWRLKGMSTIISPWHVLAGRPIVRLGWDTIKPWYVLVQPPSSHATAERTPQRGAKITPEKMDTFPENKAYGHNQNDEKLLKNNCNNESNQCPRTRNLSTIEHGQTRTHKQLHSNQWLDSVLEPDSCQHVGSWSELSR
jgi:hypothetical protein